MRKIITVSLFAIVVLITGMTSCKKFVQISPPTTQIVTASTFDNNASATAVQTGIYTQMQGNYESYDMAVQSGLLADELINYSSSLSMKEFYVNSMKSKDISAPWKNAYNYIYRANSVISGLQSYNGVTAAGKLQLTGEALFIRAFWHFYLTNCYGDVPLITTPNYNINATIFRTPQKEVFEQIIADLKNAENLLSSNYVDASDTTITADRIRPTKWAAAALLARAYLYDGIYDSAEQQATLVINNNAQYELCSNLDSVFLKNNTEAIWQLQPVEPTSNYATPDGRSFILTAAPSINTTNCTSISSQLLSIFESGDQRKADWIGTYKSGGNTYYFPNKYKAYLPSSAPTEYTVVLRLAEQYLIRAEAEAQLGDMTDAARDLNVIRARAGLGPSTVLTASSNLQQADSAVLHERQVELFTEWGHRWFDLSRTGMINNVMDSVTPLKGGGVWNVTGALYPISLAELSADPNLVQNPGY